MNTSTDQPSETPNNQNEMLLSVEVRQWIKSERKKLKLNQEEAANIIKLSTTQWSRIESGKSGTKISTLLLMGKALNIEPKEILLKAGFLNVPAPIPEGNKITNEIPNTEKNSKVQEKPKQVNTTQENPKTALQLLQHQNQNLTKVSKQLAEIITLLSDLNTATAAQSKQSEILDLRLGYQEWVQGVLIKDVEELKSKAALPSPPPTRDDSPKPKRSRKRPNYV